MKHVFFLAAASLLALPALADEGMWMPQQLPALENRLEDLGLQLDPEDLTDLTKHPMGAVISLGGCSASFVSPQGLIVTNHHCVYGSVQYNSTDENNLLDKGFLAKRQADELPAAPGSRALVTVAVTDVTSQIKSAIPAGADGGARFTAIENAEKGLVAKCEQDAGHRCNVYSYYGGLQYYLIKQMEIRDIRLVYAPADGIGKFGGDIDNWMWPRHTGDWGFYRAYVGPDGKPADFNENNIPYQPKHWLKIAPQGVAAGDYVMVIGYPGSTDRYRLAAEVKNAFEWEYPTFHRLLNEWLAIIERTTAKDKDAAIKYAGLVASLNNYKKNLEGQIEGYASSGTLARKQTRDKTLANWIQADAARKTQYGDALTELEALVAKSASTREQDLYYGLAHRSSLLGTAQMLYRLSIESEKPDAEREPGFQARDITRIKQRLMRLDRSFAPSVDKAVWQHFILGYAKIPAEQHIAAFDNWFGITAKGIGEKALNKKLDAMYAGTELGNLETRLGWMEKTPEDFRASKDPFIQLAVALYASDRQREDKNEALAGEFAQARPQYMAAMIAWQESQGQAVYPDANSTLRVTFGTVQGKSPKDGVYWTPFTSLRGIMQKSTGEEPFDSPPALLNAIKAGDYGPYAMDSLDSVPVNFLSTVDTTGGNSGSPTLNGDGELVGLLFDGTYDSIISDWDFNPESTRSIQVDARYMLWVMDYVDQADNLLKEMGIQPRSK